MLTLNERRYPVAPQSAKLVRRAAAAATCSSRLSSNHRAFRLRSLLNACGHLVIRQLSQLGSVNVTFGTHFHKLSSCEPTVPVRFVNAECRNRPHQELVARHGPPAYAKIQRFTTA